METKNCLIKFARFFKFLRHLLQMADGCLTPTRQSAILFKEGSQPDHNNDVSILSKISKITQQNIKKITLIASPNNNLLY